MLLLDERRRWRGDPEHARERPRACGRDALESCATSSSRWQWARRRGRQRLAGASRRLLEAQRGPKPITSARQRSSQPRPQSRTTATAQQSSSDACNRARASGQWPSFLRPTDLLTNLPRAETRKDGEELSSTRRRSEERARAARSVHGRARSRPDAIERVNDAVRIAGRAGAAPDHGADVPMQLLHRWRPARSTICGPGVADDARGPRQEGLGVLRQGAASRSATSARRGASAIRAACLVNVGLFLKW